MEATQVIQLIAALLSVLGFALFFNIKKNEIAALTIGGFATWLVYLAAGLIFKGAFAPTLIAAIFGAAFALALGHKFNAPASIYFFVAVITLVPGRTLYFTMYNAAIGDWGQFSVYAVETLVVVGAIAIGMAGVWMLNALWHQRKVKKIDGSRA